MDALNQGPTKLETIKLSEMDDVSYRVVELMLGKGSEMDDVS
jgi:hypothetical protein